MVIWSYLVVPWFIFGSSLVFCTEYIFMAEPQLWVNLNKIKGWEKVNLSLGTEVELSNNFVAKGFDVMPTVAVKYAF